MMVDPKEITNKVKEVGEDAEIAGRVVAGLGHAVVLAGLGAAAMARDESTSLFSKLVDRGTLVERDAEKRLESLRQRARKSDVKAEIRVENRIQGLLSQMNIPTKNDVMALEAKLNTLSAKLDGLLEKEAPTPAKKRAEKPIEKPVPA